MVASRVGERGQITIEKQIREELGVYSGDHAIQRVEDGRVVVEFVPGRIADRWPASWPTR